MGDREVRSYHHGEREVSEWYCYEHFTTSSSCQRELDSTGYEMESDLVSVSTGGSMSDYGSDLEDVELELSRVRTGPASLLTRHTVDSPAQRTQYKRYNSGINFKSRKT